MRYQMTARTNRSEFRSLFPCIRDGREAYRNLRGVSDTSRQGGMSAARQRLWRLGRAMEARIRFAASDCIVRTVSFGPDPLKAGGMPFLLCIKVSFHP